MTALTAYWSNTAASTLSTACTILTGTGASAVGKDTKIGTATGWAELYSQGNASAWAALGAIGAPSGHGWLWDTTTLEEQELIAGNWTPTFRLTLNGGLTGNVTADLVMRAYVYNATSQTYTLIGTMTLSAQTVTTTSTTFTFVATSLGVASFGLADKLYLDAWSNVTVNANTSTTATMRLNEANSTTQGVNTAQCVTPGYVVQVSRVITATAAISSLRSIPASAAALATLTRASLASAVTLSTLARAITASAAMRATLTRAITATSAISGIVPRSIPATASAQVLTALAVYPSCVADTGGPAGSGAAQIIANTTGGMHTGKDTRTDQATGWGEITALGTAANWAATGAIGAPSGLGWLLDSTFLDGQMLPGGIWSAQIRLQVSGAGTMVIDLYRRVSIRHIDGTFTTLVTMFVGSQSITTAAANYALPATPGIGYSCIPGDRLYIDDFAHITTNSTTGISYLRESTASNNTQGDVNLYCITPGTMPQPARGIITSAAVYSTLARGVPVTLAALFANLRSIPATLAGLATPSRNVVASAAANGTFTRAVPSSGVAIISTARSIPTSAAVVSAQPRSIPATTVAARAPLGMPYVSPVPIGPFLTASGSHIQYNGANVKLYGACIYLLTQGGIGAWRTTDLTLVLDDLFYRAWANGVNMIRICDFWNATDQTQTMDDPQLWANIDYCVTKAAQYGMWAMMDVSNYAKLLTSQGIDPTVSRNWSDFLILLGTHYVGVADRICWYNLSGEPALPANQAGINALASFYNDLCNTLYAADSTHLISPVGLTHMNSTVPGCTDPAWWYQIATLTHGDIFGIKEYSVNDLTYMSNIQSIFTANSINKPISINEFGAEQEQGDAAFPSFSNQLASSIAQNAVVTSLALVTPLAQTLLAGTISVCRGPRMRW